MQSIFHLRRVHIGHLAKSFGLRDAPTQIGKNTQKMKRKNEETPEQKMKKMAHQMKMNCSEFGSGL
jgi:ATP-dependent RNA helicase DDX31/DBP7